jgi:glucosylceramidase
MKRLERSLLGACVAFFVLACSSTESGSPNATGSGGSGSGGTASGAGAAGGATGATGGGGGSSSTGGSGSGSGATGGSSGGAQGGSSGASSGGSGGSPVVVERPPLVTSGAGEYWKVGTLTEVSGGTPTVTVDVGSALQTWIGFGGTFNEAGWDALGALTDTAERDRAIKLLFSPTEGANFAWGRLPLGASDYAMDRYTLDDTDNNEPDLTMEHFSIDRDKMRLIPYIKAAQQVKGDIKFWASPWTPPPWMKEPKEYDGTDEYTGTPSTFKAYISDDAAVHQAYADYFVRFIKAYEAEGIPIDHIQPQNEPGYATRYPSCLWDPGQLGKFVGMYLGPAMAEQTPNTKIWFGTLSNNDTYPDDIGGLTGDALNYTVGVGLQWNTMGRISSLLAMKSDLLIMQTEHRCGNYPFTVTNPAPFQPPAFDPDKPQNDHAYAMESWYYIREWIKAGVHSYSAWNMVLDTVGKNLDARRPWPQNALLVVDRAGNKLIETPAYYVFRHLSFFVDPGATRLSTTGGDALAFKNPDGSIVTVVFNSTTSAADTTVSLGTTTVQAQVPAQGWATVYWKG